jgi:hypothetical protein
MDLDRVVWNLAAVWLFSWATVVWTGDAREFSEAGECDGRGYDFSGILSTPTGLHFFGLPTLGGSV